MKTLRLMRKQERLQIIKSSKEKTKERTLGDPVSSSGKERYLGSTVPLGLNTLKFVQNSNIYATSMKRDQTHSGDQWNTNYNYKEIKEGASRGTNPALQGIL